jgi:Calx-beta domain/PKD domain
VPNACANSVTANFSQIDVTTSGDDGLTAMPPGGTTMTSGLSQSAAIPGAIFVAGYNLGLLVQGVNSIPANVSTTIEATNTVQGQQSTNTVGGTPPNGTVSLTTTITDPDGTPGTGDESATPASFSVNYDNLTWTTGPSGTIDYRQQSIATSPPTAANNSLLINALVGGFLGVQFRCAPGTVIPPDPGTITLIDPAPSFDTTNTCLGPTLISINDASATEGGAMSFTVSQGGCAPSSSQITVDFTTADGSAIAPFDYTSNFGTLIFDPGETSETVTVQTIDDNLLEVPETFEVNLSNVMGGAYIGDGTGVGTINDNDGEGDPAPIPNAGPDQTVASGATVSLDGTGSIDPANDPLTYQWTQTSGPAVTLSDPSSATPTFTAPTGPATLTFELLVCDPQPACRTDSVTINVQAPPMIDATGVVLLNGQVSSTKTSKSFVFKVSNIGVVPITLKPATDITASVEVNGTPTGSVSPGSGTKTITPGASTRVKLVWSYPAASVAAGDAVVFHACVNVTGDVDTTNDCDDQTATAK